MKRAHYQETALMRKQMLTLALGSAVLIAGLLLSAPAEAAFNGKTTHMTFDHPIRVPGATLPAGHYVFTVDTSNVVWIRNEDGSHVYGAYVTRPLRRFKSTSQRHPLRRKIMVERSGVANSIPTLRGWFGPHRARGYELSGKRSLSASFSARGR